MVAMPVSKSIIHLPPLPKNEFFATAADIAYAQTRDSKRLLMDEPELFSLFDRPLKIDSIFRENC